MTSRNPYLYTLPIPSSMFVGRWSLVDEILSSLCSSQLDSWIILGGRRFGKSSLLQVLEERLTERLENRVSGDWCIFPAVINLHGAETESVQDIYAYILLRLYDRLCEQTVIAADLAGTQIEAIALDEVERLTFRRFEQTLKDLIKHLESKLGPTRFILLLDEVEYATNFPWHLNLFSQLRKFVQEQTFQGVIKLVLTGSTRVLQVRQTRSSPFLNSLELRFLESLQLSAIEKLVNLGGVMPEIVSNALIEQCGGHPFVAQYLLHHLWHEKDALAQATIAQVQQVALQMHQDRFDDFQGWWESIGEEGQRIYALLADAHGDVEESLLVAQLTNGTMALDRSLRSLRYHGLVTRSDDLQRYRIAGTLFRDWYLRNAAGQNLSHSRNANTAMMPLRELLCKLYERSEDARRIVMECGLDPAGLVDGGSVVNYWTNVLIEAQKHDLVNMIVDRATAEYPKRADELKLAYKAYTDGIHQR